MVVEPNIHHIPTTERPAWRWSSSHQPTLETSEKGALNRTDRGVGQGGLPNPKAAASGEWLKGCWNYPEVADSFSLRHRNLLYCNLLVLRGASVTLRRVAPHPIVEPFYVVEDGYSGCLSTEKAMPLWRSSHFKLATKLSEMALSRADPALPIEGTIPEPPPTSCRMRVPCTAILGRCGGSVQPQAFSSIESSLEHLPRDPF
jgi:hypothetical protein